MAQKDAQIYDAERQMGRTEGGEEAGSAIHTKVKPRQWVYVCLAVTVSFTILPSMLCIPANLSPQEASLFFLFCLKTDSYFYVIKQ